MKLSIVVPVYNVEKYVERCLNSLKELDIEKEIIVVNDGSTDNSLEVVEKFKNENPTENIIIISQENQGLSEARNTGIKNARGEYISFIDSDDFVDKEKYKEFINRVIIDDVDYAIGKYSVVHENEEIENKKIRNKIIKEKEIEYPIDNGKKYLIKLFNKNMYGPEVWDDLYKRDFILKNNLFFKKDRLHEDEIFTLEVFIKAKKVKYYGINFYNYFQRKNSIMKTKNIKNYENMQKNIHNIFELFEVEKNKKIQKILIKQIHRFYKIMIIETKGIDAMKNKKYLENYQRFCKKYKENKIKIFLFRFKNSLKKRLNKII